MFCVFRILAPYVDISGNVKCITLSYILSVTFDVIYFENSANNVMFAQHYLSHKFYFAERNFHLEISPPYC